MSNQDVWMTQRSFARKAAAQPEHRFEDLYHLICREDWIEAALKHVLTRKGANTPGIDGVTKRQLQNEEERRAFIQQLRHELKARTFQPQPVERTWMPKPGKTTKRPIGIPTLQDRVVQQLLRMVMEPIWESDFKSCAHGYRPGHNVMDCIAPLYGHINQRQKFFWVLEGDIKGCFDHINHRILMRLVRRRIKDRHILALLQAFLKAGVMEGQLFKRTPEGTPQGAIISPLLSNIYLHELDCWYWRQWRSRTQWQRCKARLKGSGQLIMYRYADDFIILWNGPKAELIQIREELRQFLAEELHLELSLEKTKITHVTEGFDFLGFHIRYYKHRNRKPVLLIKPTKENIKRFRLRIKGLTKRTMTFAMTEHRFKAVNSVLRGWANYYRHVNAKEVFNELDFWAEKRVVIWLMAKHGKGVRWVLRRYQQLDTRNGRRRKNLRTPPKEGSVWLYKMSDIPIQHLHNRTIPNPYLAEAPSAEVEVDTPFQEPIWGGVVGPDREEWLLNAQLAKERDGGRCQRCGTTRNTDVHHIVHRDRGGEHELDNLITLCRSCHLKQHRAKT